MQSCGSSGGACSSRDVHTRLCSGHHRASLRQMVTSRVLSAVSRALPRPARASGRTARLASTASQVFQRDDPDDGNKIVVEMNGNDERSCTKTYLVADKYR